jgi:hypothetical protein
MGGPARAGLLERAGPVEAGRLLTTAGISPSKIVGALSERQRARLIEPLSR